MKSIIRNILIIVLFLVLIMQSVSFASMADFTDEAADKEKENVQKETKNEIESRINKSSNNYLKSLSIKGYSISPNFDKQTINYEIKETIKESTLEISAEADDSKATISGIGKVNINAGENDIKIDVKAENGTTRSYIIKVKADLLVENKTTNTEVVENIASNTIINEAKQESNKQSDETQYKGAIIGVIIIVILLLILMKGNKKKRRR